MTTKPLVRFAAAALAAASLVTTSAAKPKAPGQGQPGQGMPGRGNGYTKEQVVPLALAGFDTLQQALDATYKDQGYGQTVVAAKAKFQENAQAALPETNPNGQPKRYSDRELWVMQQVVDVTVRTVQDGISIMVEGRRKGVSAEDIDHNLRTMRAQNAVKIQRIVDDNAHELGSAGAGFAGGIVDHLGPDGARNSEGTPFWLDPKKSPLVVLAMESTNCVMHPEQCKITVSPPVVTPTPTPTPAPPPVVSNPTTGKPETPSNPKPEPEYPSNPQPETPAGNGGPSVDQLYSNITNGASGAGAVNVMNDRGAYLLERGRYSDALQLAKTALSLDPKNKNALALLHSVNGRVEGGAVGAAGGADAAARAAALGAGGREGF
ncbi:MAG: tetratricopeptide repeat protein, partial [Elusimicrobia bacterium]|nr:tetratricopeptide repeat protein [Elusimicrobiota bacterium]